ncbi:hypothetical protein H8E77_28020 [bacterium]|nr:hypothetical protein [bacterium]
MTHRERLLAVIDGKHLDRIPWIPRLHLWYNAHKQNGTLPEKYQHLTLRDIERDLGLGTPAREGRIHIVNQKGNIETKSYRKGVETITEYITPAGTVWTSTRGSDELAQKGIGGRTTAYMIKNKDDYAVVEYMVENTEYIPAYDAYIAYEGDIGEDGYPKILLGSAPMGQIMREYIGYNNFYYELADNLAQIEHLHGILVDKAKELWKIVLESPAKLFLYGVHFDSQFTPPPLFAQYFLPYFQEFSALLHQNDQLIACHADADTSLLLDLIMAAGFDMAESFVTSPMVPVTLKQARQAWGNNVIIWGGIPSAIMCEPITDEDFEEYMLDLFQTIAPGDAFILGVADNVMPEAKIERVKRVTEMVDEYGQYPITM